MAGLLLESLIVSALLRSLSDRQLSDIGLDRYQIGEGLAELAKRSQQSTHAQ